MTANFSPLEEEIELFLKDKGITTPIFLTKFPVDAPDHAILIDTGPSGQTIPVEAPVDSQRVKIINRDARFEIEDALNEANEIANIIHGTTPGKIHPTSNFRFLSALIDERPQRDDDDDKDRPQFFAFYVVRVIPL